MIPLNKFVQVKERGDLKVASQFIETINSPDVFTPSHCAVVEVVDSNTGFSPGELVVVAAGSLSAFLVEDGQQLIVLPAHEVQARYNERDGVLIPLGRRLVVQKDDDLMKELVLGEKSSLVLPPSVLSGLSISGEKQPKKDDRKEDVQTGLYCPIVSRGPKASDRLKVGDVVAFSPTIDVAQLTVRAETYFVVLSEDVFGYWDASDPRAVRAARRRKLAAEERAARVSETA